MDLNQSTKDGWQTLDRKEPAGDSSPTLHRRRAEQSDRGFLAQIIMNHQEKLPNPHPGQILQKEFLEPMGLSAEQLSEKSGISNARLKLLIDAEADITSDLAKALSRTLGTTSEFWINLQASFDEESR